MPHSGYALRPCRTPTIAPCTSLTVAAAACPCLAGYGQGPAPHPDCDTINLLIIFNIIFASLIDYLLMGLVFAR